MTIGTVRAARLTESAIQVWGATTTTPSTARLTRKSSASPTSPSVELASDATREAYPAARAAVAIADVVAEGPK